MENSLTVFTAARAVIASRNDDELQERIDDLAAAVRADSKSRSRRAMHNSGGRPPIDAAPILRALRAGKSVAEIAQTGLASESTIRGIKRAAGL